MKILELFEKLTANVHVNSDKTLYVIADLVQKQFGPSFDKISGGCLAAQMIYSMASAAGVNPALLMSALNRSNLTAGYEGAKLDDLYQVFNKKPIKMTSKEQLTFKLSVETPTIDEAIKEVKNGQPIIFIPSIVIQKRFENAEDDDGIAKLTSGDMKRQLTSQVSYHAYLLIGYDEDGYLIFREMRSSYGYKGYIKASTKVLKQNPKAYKFIAIVVDEVKQEKL